MGRMWTGGGCVRETDNEGQKTEKINYGRITLTLELKQKEGDLPTAQNSGFRHEY